ncbi:MAG: M23 family metallopeptidase [Candidatus Dormibacteria bacterium]
MGVMSMGGLVWHQRAGAGRVLGLAIAAVMALPVMLGLLGVALASAAGPPVSGPTGRPMAAWVVTQPYGCTGLGMEPARGDCAHFHFGIDLAAPAGTAVAAVAPGTLEVLPPSGYSGGYGLHILVHHAAGTDTLYAHLADTIVVSGERVMAGTTIGHEGSTGMSTGPHLHFEVREAGVAVDPVSVFPGIFGPEGQAR